MKKSAFSMYRALLLGAWLTAGTVTLAPAVSRAAPAISVEIGPPPPPRTEVVPPPRRGFVWAPGYWAWRGHRHVWVRGRWMRVRPGYRYMPPRWREGPHGHWHFSAGYWGR